MTQQKLTPSQVATLRAYRKSYKLRSVSIITEWRDGCVYRTKFVGFIIADSDYRLGKNVEVGSVSTSITRLLL